MSALSDGRHGRTTDAPLVMKWSLFLAIACGVAYTCLLIMRPFFGVIAWATVLAITCHPFHQRLVQRTGRVALSAFVTSTLVVLAVVVPLVGTAAVWVPGTVYLVLAGSWPKAIVLAVWGAAVVSSVDNVLRPKLVAGRVRLSGLAMFVAMLGGLQAFGALGIVVGPVVFATAAAILVVLRDTPPTPAPRADAVDANRAVPV